MSTRCIWRTSSSFPWFWLLPHFSPTPTVPTAPPPAPTDVWHSSVWQSSNSQAANACRAFLPFAKDLISEPDSPLGILWANDFQQYSQQFPRRSRATIEIESFWVCNNSSLPELGDVKQLWKSQWLRVNLAWGPMCPSSSPFFGLATGTQRTELSEGRTFYGRLLHEFLTHNLVWKWVLFTKKMRCIELGACHRSVFSQIRSLGMIFM